MVERETSSGVGESGTIRLQCVNGHAASEGQRFCPECGAELQSRSSTDIEVPEASAAPAPPSGSGPAKLSTHALTSAVFLLLGFALLPIIGQILALRFAKKARAEIESSQGSLKGIWLVTASRIVAKAYLSFAGLAVVVVVIASLVKSHGPSTSSASSVGNSGTTATATVAVPVDQAPAAPTTRLDVTGSGTHTTQSFTTSSSDWILSWAYDCSSFGQAGNFQVYVYNGDGTLSDNEGPNDLAMKNNGVEYMHSGGTMYLEINSECGWHVRVSG